MSEIKQMKVNEMASKHKNEHEGYEYHILSYSNCSTLCLKSWCKRAIKILSCPKFDARKPPDKCHKTQAVY